MSRGMWTKQYTSNGTPFYYNATLGRSVWKPPPDGIVHEAECLKKPGETPQTESDITPQPTAQPQPFAVPVPVYVPVPVPIAQPIVQPVVSSMVPVAPLPYVPVPSQSTNMFVSIPLGNDQYFRLSNSAPSIPVSVQQSQPQPYDLISPT
jgi:hypothetical protein